MYVIRYYTIKCLVNVHGSIYMYIAASLTKTFFTARHMINVKL